MTQLTKQIYRHQEKTQLTIRNDNKNHVNF